MSGYEVGYKPTIKSLPQAKDRLSFLYLERCVINRQDSALTVTDVRGVVHVPAAAISVLLLGPGTSVTHRAMELLGDVGASIVWVGESGVRYYAHGRPLTTASRLLSAQAKLVSNVRTHAEVARKMYVMRFPDEDVSGLTIQQLRGKEGTRVRALYAKMSKETGVAWYGRTCDYATSDIVNKALSEANVCLYGIVHSVLVALGCSPGLGFVHVGHERSFVYDVADLYKAEITIPLAFKVAAISDVDEDVSVITRRKMRDVIAASDIISRIVKDTHSLLVADDSVDVDVLYLWDDKLGLCKSGISYGMSSENELDDQEEGYGVLL